MEVAGETGGLEGPRGGDCLQSYARVLRALHKAR